MRLAVRQFERICGWLESTPDRGLVFRYDEAYLASPKARGLSLSLPLRAPEFSQAQALPYFSGLLPDGDLRRRIADYLHVSEASIVRLLEALGGECAGTVSVLRVDTDGGSPNLSEGYEALGREELERLIRELELVPLLAPKGGARLSLAGAQEKIPLYASGGVWYRPLGGAPSSHILKPASRAFPEIVENEFACLRLAASLGLGACHADIEPLGRPVLVLSRYDRFVAEDGRLGRLQQEDFCQALGILPERKYEGDGGPSFSDLARLIRRSCAKPLSDLERLASAAIFNVFLGNCDAHGKNYSLLYGASGIELAPLYDLVSTTLWPQLDTRLSMRFGTEFHLERLGPADLDAFAESLGVKPRLVRDRADSLAASGGAAWDAVMSLKELAGAAPMLERMREGWNSRVHALGFEGR